MKIHQHIGYLYGNLWRTYIYIFIYMPARRKKEKEREREREGEGEELLHFMYLLKIGPKVK